LAQANTNVLILKNDLTSNYEKTLLLTTSGILLVSLWGGSSDGGNSSDKPVTPGNTNTGANNNKNPLTYGDNCLTFAITKSQKDAIQNCVSTPMGRSAARFVLNP
jgi:hypothetical protein